MSFGKIKLDPADIQFSIYIRLRDRHCMRCGRRGDGPLGIDGLQCSHFFGRGRETTRFDTENCDALCAGCHRLWESDFREDYADFKKAQLGIKRFNLMRARSYMIGKKDRKLALLMAKQLVKDIKTKLGLSTC